MYIKKDGKKVKDLLGQLCSSSKIVILLLLFEQDIGITMGIDPAPFWENLFLFFYFKLVQNLISKNSTRAYEYHATS